MSQQVLFPWHFTKLAAEATLIRFITSTHYTRIVNMLLASGTFSSYFSKANTMRHFGLSNILQLEAQSSESQRFHKATLCDASIFTHEFNHAQHLSEVSVVTQWNCLNSEHSLSSVISISFTTLDPTHYENMTLKSTLKSPTTLKNHWITLQKIITLKCSL